MASVAAGDQSYAHTLDQQVAAQKRPLPVVLHVYDMGRDTALLALNQVLRDAGTGAFHAAVEVLGKEWSYGQTDGEGSGVYSCEPKGNNMHTYRESLPLGETCLSPKEVKALLQRLKREWRGADYDVLRRNCCSFCSTLAQELGVSPVPSWVTNLAAAGAGEPGCAVEEPRAPASGPQDTLPGPAILQDLLHRTPREVTGWVLDQAEQLSRAGASDLERLPIFKLAGALRGAPLDQKRSLVRSTIAGFGELPVPRRAEAVRLAVQTVERVQRADGRNQRRLEEEIQRLAALGGRASTGAADGPPAADAGRAPHLELPGLPPLVQNLMRVAEEARLDSMSAGDMASIAQEAQTVAGQVMQPQQLIDVITELEPGEREQLTDALVEAHVVPADQREVFEDAVRPGGYADKLSAALKLLDTVFEYKWAFVALPVAEMFLGVVLGLCPCSQPLLAWLRLDSLLALGFAATVYCLGQTLTPVYLKLRQDPVGAAQRWQTAEESQDWNQRLEVALPGVGDVYCAGGAGTAGCLALVLGGTLWAVNGVFELFAAMLLGCAHIILVVSLVFIGLRVGIIIALVLVAVHVLGEIREHQSRGLTLESSQLPMMEADTGPRFAVASHPEGPPQQGMLAPRELAGDRPAPRQPLPRQSEPQLTSQPAGASQPKPVAVMSGRREPVYSEEPDRQKTPGAGLGAAANVLRRLDGEELHQRASRDHTLLMQRLAGFEEGTVKAANALNLALDGGAGRAEHPAGAASAAAAGGEAPTAPSARSVALQQEHAAFVQEADHGSLHQKMLKEHTAAVQRLEDLERGRRGL